MMRHNLDSYRAPAHRFPRALLLLGAMLATRAQALTGGVSAGQPATPAVLVQVGPDGTIDLEARSVPIGQVLEALAQRLSVPIHYQAAPPQPVAIACHARGLEAVLRCALGTGADLAFAYAGGAGDADRRPASVKVLASTFDEFPATAGAQAHPVPGEALPARETPPRLAAGESLDALLGDTHNADPELRAQALERLRQAPGADEATLRAAYQAALSDPNGDVRAEALTGMALLDEEHSFGLLSSAMLDGDASVRLAALDNLELDRRSRAIYRTALGDPDESVRELAALRLGLE
ncbi:hypothetical protein [Methyloparacoccus murrellii]